MGLTPGTRIGAYEVHAALGAGGMGEVYRARDTKLDRDVAIKILPEAFADDPQRVARFEREAKTLAALNHPNIGAIYGLEERALVLELVEGPTLADRIAQGPIPVAEALAIARQIAEALEAAHELGIIHRDLKPANIKVRDDGTVKVLDFGLAKLAQPSEAGVQVAAMTASPTLSLAATHAGVILGTAAYMAPEQAKGRPVDARSDLWAFGCVLYEMLTGTRAFDGEDLTEILGAVVRLEPDWTALPADVPVTVRSLLQTCLTKDRRKRRVEATTALFVLENVGRVLSDPPESRVRKDPAYVRSLRWSGLLVAAAAACVSGAIVGAAVWWVTRPALPAVVRTEIMATGTAALHVQGFDRDIAITPDGARVVYRGNNQILVRALDQLQPAVLDGLGAPRGLFVSPDGQWVGFFDGPFLKKVALSGGPGVTIARMMGAPRGATWGPDGSIVFATGAPDVGLQRVAAAGGEAEVLTRPNRETGAADHIAPEFLPDGRGVLFTITARSGIDDAQIAVFDFATGAYKVLLRSGSHALYVRTGHLVYGSGNTLRAVPFDLDRLEVTGAPVPVLENVLMTATGAVDLAIAPNGTVVYVTGSRVAGAMRSLAWVDRSGREEPLPAPQRAYVYPRISPDGTRLGLQIADQDNDVWIWTFARNTLTRLTFGSGLDRYSVWTPDGKRIVFTSESGTGTGGGIGISNLFWQAADGTGSPERLTESPNTQFPMSFSPDGRFLLFYQTSVVNVGLSGGRGAGADLMVLEMGDERRARPLIQTTYVEMNAEVSPNGRWVAYQSDESGQDEIYVRPFPDVNGGRWQVSTAGGTRPLWARSGRELFYLSPALELMRLEVDREDQFAFGTPTSVLKGGIFGGSVIGGGSPGRTYDISPDGGRFLIIKDIASTQNTEPPRLIVVQNWDQELKRLVPTN